MKIRRPIRRLPLCLLLLTSAGGCGSGGVGPPPVDPVAATDAALEMMDGNGDGMLDSTELEASPPLLAALVEYDTNGDKKIDREELLFRFNAMYERGVGLVAATATVYLNNKPLQGADVIYVPEPYLGEGTTHIAGGVTDAKGQTRIAVPAEKVPEEYRKFGYMQVGLYRVKIKHPTKQIPAEYNEQTELGFEVHPDAHYGQDAEFRLKS